MYCSLVVLLKTTDSAAETGIDVGRPVHSTWTLQYIDEEHFHKRFLNLFFETVVVVFCSDRQLQGNFVYVFWIGRLDARQTCSMQENTLIVVVLIAPALGCIVHCPQIRTKTCSIFWFGDLYNLPELMYRTAFKQLNSSLRGNRKTDTHTRLHGIALSSMDLYLRPLLKQKFLQVNQIVFYSSI